MDFKAVSEKYKLFVSSKLTPLLAETEIAREEVCAEIVEYAKFDEVDERKGFDCFVEVADCCQSKATTGPIDMVWICAGLGYFVFLPLAEARKISAERKIQLTAKAAFLDEKAKSIKEDISQAESIIEELSKS